MKLKKIKTKKLVAKTAAPVPTPKTKVQGITVMDCVAVLKRRIGTPMLCRVKQEGDTFNMRVTAAELRYEKLSPKVIQAGMADLTPDEVLAATGNDWGASHRGSWFYVTEGFRIKFEFRRYTDGHVMCFVSTTFSTPAERAK